MEIETTEQTVETVETPAEETIEGISTASDEADADQTTQEEEVSSWTPEYKFKVLDSEHEMDEWVKSLQGIDEDTYKNIQSLYSKAYGIEGIKEDRNQIRTERDAIKSEYEALQIGLNKVNTYLNNGDFRTFATELGIPKEMILRYALEELQYQDMSPEQRAQFEAGINQRQQMYQTQWQAEQLQQQNAQQAQIVFNYELDRAMAEHNLGNIEKEYDARIGQPGAFRSGVIETGKFHAYQGRELSVAQAATEFAKKIGSMVTQGTAEQQTPTQVAPTSTAKKPVIPNLQGKGTTPVKKVPTSVAELRELAAR